MWMLSDISRDGYQCLQRKITDNLINYNINLIYKYINGMTKNRKSKVQITVAAFLMLLNSIKKIT